MPQNKSIIKYLFSWVLFGILIGIIVLFIRANLSFPLSMLPFQTNNFSPKIDLQQSYSPAVSHALPSVVSIQSINWVEQELREDIKPSDKLSLQLLDINSLYISQRKPIIASGSGVIINNQGYILTSYHVIAQRDEIRVTLHDNRSAIAKLIGADIDTDLAILKIDLKNLPNPKIADIASLNVGDIVLAIGNPFSLGLTVTQGIISATGRKRIALNSYANFIQTDAAVNPGNSGGALINTHGEIIGINSNIYTNSGNFQGISFAIPIDLAQRVAQQIIEHGQVVRGWLGIEGRELTSQVRRTIDNKPIQGVLISDIDLGGPSDAAGLKVGDIITNINQKNITKTSDILDLLANSKPGHIFIITGTRKNQSFVVKVILGRRRQHSQ